MQFWIFELLTVDSPFIYALDSQQHETNLIKEEGVNASAEKASRRTELAIAENLMLIFDLLGIVSWKSN